MGHDCVANYIYYILSDKTASREMYQRFKLSFMQYIRIFTAQHTNIIKDVAASAPPQRHTVYVMVRERAHCCVTSATDPPLPVRHPTHQRTHTTLVKSCWIFYKMCSNEMKETFKEVNSIFQWYLLIVKWCSKYNQYLYLVQYRCFLS